MRLFEFEDDLGNYVQDPKLRRPVGALSSTGTSSDNVCHAGISVNVCWSLHYKLYLSLCVVFMSL